MLEIAVLCRAKRSIFTDQRICTERGVPRVLRDHDAASHGYQLVNSDHIMLMQFLQMYVEFRDEACDNPERLKAWCSSRRLDMAALDEAAAEVAALRTWLATHPRITVKYHPQKRVTPILPALVRAFSSQLALAVRGYPSSAVFMTVPHGECARVASGSLISLSHSGDWVIYNSMSHCLGKNEMHLVSAVDPQWLFHLPFFREDGLLGRGIAVTEGRLAQEFVLRALDDGQNQATGMPPGARRQNPAEPLRRINLLRRLALGSA